MPCNSDYMNPTPEEHRQSDEQKTKIKENLDYLVHQADLMREDILAVVQGRQKKTTINFSRIPFGTPDLDALIQEHDNMYVHTRSDSLNTLIHAVKEQYQMVLEAGKDLERDGRLKKSRVNHIETQQILHRFGDMIRVMGQYTAQTTFTRKQMEEIRKFATVDYTNPLIPQIGFDPDDV